MSLRNKLLNLSGYTLYCCIQSCYSDSTDYNIFYLFLFYILVHKKSLAKVKNISSIVITSFQQQHQKKLASFLTHSSCLCEKMLQVLPIGGFIHALWHAQGMVVAFTTYMLLSSCVINTVIQGRNFAKNLLCFLSDFNFWH